METFKSYKAFKEKVIEHLTKRNKKPYGIYLGNGEPYGHIVRIPQGSSQLEVIKTIIKNDKVNPDLFTEPHRYAHHLNSSQVVCYEFFRPLISTDKKLLPEMIGRLSQMGLPQDYFKNGYAEFEYVPYPEENTNFDFFIQSDRVKAYFEIKYTEQGFGQCANDKKHKDKFTAIYKPMIEDCACLKRKPSFDEFRKNYQLFRNTLRITKENWQNEYVIFLFPRENTIAQKHFNEFFNEFIDKNYHAHVLSVHWEDLTMSKEFQEKFFFYTL